MVSSFYNPGYRKRYFPRNDSTSRGKGGMRTIQVKFGRMDYSSSLSRPLKRSALVEWPSNLSVKGLFYGKFSITDLGTVRRVITVEITSNRHFTEIRGHLRLLLLSYFYMNCSRTPNSGAGKA